MLKHLNLNFLSKNLPKNKKRKAKSALKNQKIKKLEQKN